MKHEKHPYSQWVDLASRQLGGQVLSCSDDFFAEMENLIKPEAPIFITDKYTDRGKWMDGWETRRKREVGYDWAILRLGASGHIVGFNVCTRFFAGNAPQQISIEGCRSMGTPTADTQWTSLLEHNDIKPDSDNFIDLTQGLDQIWTHLRLNIFPDGGVARLRVYGQAALNTEWLLPNEPIDLASVQHGARPLMCSDMFFSSMNNLLLPQRGKNMGDGWETKRRRGGRECDWIIVALAVPGTIHKVCVDTAHFKGNFPHSFTLDAVYQPEGKVGADSDWQKMIDHQLLSADSEHFYRQQIIDNQKVVTHVRLNIFPDGGVSRLRVIGYPQGLE
ncbi:MAG: allantoicase [Oleibacter sp.]|nr:allantoicase [Thalassolituus sp.]